MMLLRQTLNLLVALWQVDVYYNVSFLSEIVFPINIMIIIFWYIWSIKLRFKGWFACMMDFSPRYRTIATRNMTISLGITYFIIAIVLKFENYMLIYSFLENWAIAIIVQYLLIREEKDKKQMITRIQVQQSSQAINNSIDLRNLTPRHHINPVSTVVPSRRKNYIERSNISNLSGKNSIILSGKHSNSSKVFVENQQQQQVEEISNKEGVDTDEYIVSRTSCKSGENFMNQRIINIVDDHKRSTKDGHIPSPLFLESVKDIDDDNENDHCTFVVDKNQKSNYSIAAIIQRRKSILRTNNFNVNNDTDNADIVNNMEMSMNSYKIDSVTCKVFNFEEVDHNRLLSLSHPQTDCKRHDEEVSVLNNLGDNGDNIGKIDCIIPLYINTNIVSTDDLEMLNNTNLSCKSDEENSQEFTEMVVADDVLRIRGSLVDVILPPNVYRRLSLVNSIHRATFNPIVFDKLFAIICQIFFWYFIVGLAEFGIGVYFSKFDIQLNWCDESNIFRESLNFLFFVV